MITKQSELQSIRIGVLGLQGAFNRHKEQLNRLGVTAPIVRYPQEVSACHGLIIPGGESTTMSKLIDTMGLRKSLEDFNGPILGTCAGAILLSEQCDDSAVKLLKKVPVKGIRNAYGRQIDSFSAEITLTFDKQPFHGIFIRAPKLTSPAEEVVVIGTFGQEPVLLRYANYLIATFHPELTGDLRIHQYFLNLFKP